VNGAGPLPRSTISVDYLLELVWTLLSARAAHLLVVTNRASFHITAG
jgi:hypothetical protein